MTMFKEVADIKTADQLHLPTPKANYETVVVKPSEIQKQMVQALSERAAKVHARQVEPTEDNMLKITSDGRKLGLDQRLINPLLPDDPGSKVNACVNNVFRIWDEGRDKRLTQLVFCDLSTPKGKSTTPDEKDNFNVYDDIRSKLMAKGVPAEEIAFIHDADTEAKKKELFAKVRSGQVRVLIGSTAKMGAGTNSLICRWFRDGVLPQDRGLEAALVQRLNEKRCAVCGRKLYQTSNRTKYCPACSKRIRRRKETERMRKARLNVRI